MEAREILIYLASKYDGDYESIMQAIKNREEVKEKEIEEVISSMDSKALTIIDKEYPESWKNSPNPPICVFYYGDISLIENSKNCVSYVGSREASPYGIRTAKEFVGALSKANMTIVSGLARGIDYSVAEATKEAGGKAVAILGSGIDLCYPSSSIDLYEWIKTHGLLLSEYPKKSKPKRSNFPIRNRLIAATSDFLIVGEASLHSGTLITVNYALGMSKDVGCIPFEASMDSACNRLIQDGAYLLDSVKDALYFVGKGKD